MIPPSKEEGPVKVAFIVYNGMTSLDFIGVYDPLTRLRRMGFIPDLRWDVCAYSYRAYFQI